jgi:O-antigen polysaccharide polymerase Wzy
MQMKTRNKKLLLGVFEYTGLVMLCALIFEFKFDQIGITFLIVSIELIFIVSFYASQRLSLALVYFIFAFIFLNLLPWLHYSGHINIWRTHSLKSQTYLTTNFLVFITNAVVVVVNQWVTRFSPSVKLVGHAPSLHGKLSGFVLLSLSLTGFCITLILNDFSISNLLFRGLIDEVRVSPVNDLAVLLLLSMGSRMLTFFSFLYAIAKLKNNIILKLILFLLLLITIFPTGVPRYLVGMVYIPLALIFFPKLRNGVVFSSLLIFSIIIFFPLVDQFRNFSGLENIKIVPSIDYFYAAHFDAYENMASAIEAEFITYGRQLLGVGLFWIPRSFWLTKPVGSGSEMADKLGYSFNNISMPYLGEGYINFGFIGVIVFSMVLAYVIAKIDRYFKSRIQEKDSVDFLDAFYFYLIGGLFFLMRGDLLSSFSYLSSGIFIAIFLSRFMPIFERRKIRR